MKRSFILFYFAIITFAITPLFAQRSAVFIDRLHSSAVEPIQLNLPTGLFLSFDRLQADSTLGTRILAAMNATYNRMKPFDRHGVAASVIVPGFGQWSGAVGTNDGTSPMDTSLLFECASNTKTFVTALIMRLQDSGKLSINDLIYKWLTKNYPNVDSSITIKMLLNHSSGIYDFLNDDPNGTLIDNEYLSDPSRVWTPDDILLNYVGKPNFAPGTSYKYSNTNFMLLGLIAEQAAGMPLRDQMHKFLIDPLKLKHTFFGGEDSITERFAYNWTDADSTHPAETYYDIDKTAQLTGAWGVGNICSTPADLVRWSHALYLGKIVSPSALKQMTMVNAWPDGITRYGLGTLFAPYYTKSFYGHNGSLPGFKSDQFTNLADSVSICAYVNWDANPNITDLYLNDYLLDLLGEIYAAPASVAEENAGTSINVSVFPNPATDHIIFDYRTNRDGIVHLSLINMLGVTATTVVDQEQSPGIHTATINVGHLARGMYMYVLQTADGVSSGNISIQ